MKKKIALYLSSVVIVLTSVVVMSNSALAGTATVSWAEHPNTDGDLAGFKIYYGTTSRGSAACTTDSHGYTNNVDAGNVLTHPIDNLTNGQRYYFSVVAYDTSGNKSCFSSEVNKTISDSAPAITSPADGSTLTGASQFFQWSANGENVTNWGIDVRNSSGQNIFSHGGTGNPAQDQDTSTTVTNLPTDGSDVVATLWYMVDGNWQSAISTYTAAQIFNLEDFRNLIPYWLQSVSPGNAADVHRDNVVNTRDLGIMMSNWQ